MYITCLKTKQILDVEPGVYPSYYHNLLGWLDRLFARLGRLVDYLPTGMLPIIFQKLVCHRTNHFSPL